MDPLHLFKLRWILQPPASRFALSCLVVLLSLSESINLKAQNYTVIDSLKTVLENSIEDTNKVKTLNLIAKQYLNSGKSDTAIQYANKALLLCERLNYDHGYGLTYKILGDLYNNNSKSDFGEAEKNYRAAILYLEKTADNAALAKTWNNLGVFYYNQGNFEKTIECYSASLRIKEELGDKQSIALTLDNISIVYSMMDNYPEALVYGQKSLAIAEEIGNKNLIAKSFNSIGNTYYGQGNDSEAIEFFQKALNIFEEIGDKPGIATTYGNLGNIMEDQGMFPQALDYYLKALKVHEENGNKRNIATGYNNISLIYGRMGDLESELKMLQNALNVIIEMDAKDLKAHVYNNMGTVYKKMGQYQEALESYKIALKIAQENKYLEIIGKSYLKIGNYYQDMKKFPESLKYLTMALDISEQNNFIPAMLEAKVNIGLVLFQMHNFPEARSICEEAFSLYKKQGYKDGIMECYKLSYAIDSAEGKYMDALEDYKLYTSYKDSLLLEKTSKELAGLKIQFETENKDKEINLLNQENDIQALQISKQKLQRNSAIISIALLLAIGFLVFRSLHLRKKLEKQSAIIQERKRISADLHDDIGTGLSKISLLSEIVRSQAKTPAAKKEAEKIADTSKELLQSIGEIIWALNANNDHLENLVSYIRRYAAGYFENSNVDLNISAPDNIPQAPVSGECRRNVFYAVKEAIHNILKHAQASRAEISITLENSLLSVVIRDNGSGMPEGDLNRFGNGIRNMKHRMEKINGRFKVENDCGTKVTLALPL